MKEKLKQYKFVVNTHRRIRRSLLHAKVNVVNGALDAGFLPGHTSYTRFVIISRGRSGTSFLRSLLNGHPQVNIFGEIFRKQGEIGWDRADYRSSSKQLNLIQTEPVSFLENDLFRKYPNDITAVGFKLFYYHARTPEWEPVWQFLQDSPNIRVIHLRRKNVLATHLSLRRAFLTDKWSSSSDKSESVPPINLTHEERLEAFEATRNWEQQIDSCFMGYEHKLDMSYEALSADSEAEMKRVQSFLSLDYFSTRSRLRKQNKRTLAESIANYDELKEGFSGSEFQKYFVD